MTMDIANQQRTDAKMPSPKICGDVQVKSEYNSSIPAKTSSLKRSFDVAFLMMPDERFRQKQIEKQARLQEAIDRHNPTDLSPKQNHHHHHHHQHQHNHHVTEHLINPELFNNSETRRYPQITIRAPRIYDDPTILPDRTNFPDMDNPKSAFTKVSQGRLESPIPPLSPDQMSCPSMSPPISTTPPRTATLYHSFRPEYQFNGAFQTVGQVQAIAAQNNRIKQQLMYRPMGNSGSPDLMPGYIPAGAFPFAGHGHPFAPQPDITGIVRNPAAAAILSTLIPPTLATTFSLTAQNVCAKCNISFRMTSDLVYHMRSHHKSEVAGDPNRRKREEKLKCPVCNESFRERHHLTRHMTAHQDKESDQTDTDEHSSAHRRK